MNSLNDSFRIIGPKIAKSLLNDENLSRIEQVASRLPSIHRAGFEYQFLNPERGLDFQQCVPVTSESYSHLTSKCNEFGATKNVQTDFLNQIIKLCKLGLTPNNPINQCIREMWFEFDTGINRPQPFPSVFLALHRQQQTTSLVLSAIQEAQQILGGKPLDEISLTALIRALDLLVESNGITHVGFMLGRPIRAVRIIVPIDFDVPDIRALLNEWRLNGDCQLLCCTYQLAKPLFPEIRLCIDIHEGISVASGLECFFHSPNNPRTGVGGAMVALEKLREMGMCRPEEQQAFQHWASEVFPPSCKDDWPESLILESITKPANNFSRIETGFSHVKFGTPQAGPLVTKMYFGYRSTFMEK